MDHTPRSPEQIESDRKRYEEHQRLGLKFSSKSLPETSKRPAPELDENMVRYQDVIPGGWYTVVNLNRGEKLRLVTGDMPSTMTMVGWNSADTSERMNLADTVKLQWTTSLSKGLVIFTDMGRVMFSIIEDSCGHHDILAGASTPQTVAQYNDPGLRNTRENMLLAVSKLGLDKRDIPSFLNLFAPVSVNDKGNISWVDDKLKQNEWIEIRAEMDVHIALSNCPHPLAPNAGKTPSPMSLFILKAEPIDEDDLCRTASAEALRGFENNLRMEGT